MSKKDFDPVTIQSLSGAFDLAWRYVEKSPLPIFDNPKKGREELAAIIVSIAQDEIELGTLRIANSAVAVLRRTGHQRQFKQRIEKMRAGRERRLIPSV